MTERIAYNKPLIREVASNPPASRYWCRDHATLNSAFGPTATAAYMNWIERDSKRSTMARAGWWNKKDCMQWFNQGCRAMSYYIGNKQIVGYLPRTDELVLRG